MGMKSPGRWHEDCTQCYYCEMYLARRHEHDHFPVPRKYGGEFIVPVCVNCHDLKDRIGLNNWPLDGAMIAIAQIFEVLVPAHEFNARINLPLPREYPNWLSPYLSWQHVEPHWQDLAPITRVLYGRLSVIERKRRAQLAAAADETSVRLQSAAELWEGVSSLDD